MSSVKPAVRTVLHAFPSFDIGGAQMRLVQLANHFGDRYRHLIMAMDGNAGALARIDKTVHAEVLQVAVKHGKTLGNLGHFRRLLAEINPDLLVTSNWGSIDWALSNMVAAKPHLHLEDGFGPEEKDRQLPRRVWIRRLCLRRSTILLPSQTLYKIAREQWRMPEANLLYVPNGIDCNRFVSVPDWDFAGGFGIVPGEPIVGTVAGLRAEKNVRRLIDAFAILTRQRPARLVLIGDGPERAALQQHVATLGLSDRVIFTGNCSAPEKLLPSLDVFALSSDTEQMPLSLLEAMAAARPVASTAVGDVANMVASENLPYVVDRDAQALADAILGLFADPSRAAAIGAANARRTREQFAQESMFERFEKLFDGDVFRR